MPNILTIDNYIINLEGFRYIEVDYKVGECTLTIYDGDNNVLFSQTIYKSKDEIMSDILEQIK